MTLVVNILMGITTIRFHIRIYLTY